MTLHELWITVNDAGGAHYHPLGESEAREHAAAHGCRVALLREVVTCETCAHFDVALVGCHSELGPAGFELPSAGWHCADWRAKEER